MYAFISSFIIGGLALSKTAEELSKDKPSHAKACASLIAGAAGIGLVNYLCGSKSE